MAGLIRGYDSVPRIATFRFPNGCPSGSAYEQALLSGGTLTFLSDGVSFDLGEDAEKFRDRFSDGDIITVSDRGVVNTIYDNAEHDATVYITGKCNSNCIMCPCSDFERSTDDGFSDEWMEAYIGMLPEDITHIVVTGGEPTLKTSQFFMVMDRLASRFPRTETLLLTNGRSFSSAKLLHRLLDRCPPYLVVAVPLHGSDAELHDRISRAPGSFRQTCQGISNLLANKVAVELRIVVSQLNARRLTDIASFIADRFPDVLTVNFIGLETLGNCAKNFRQVYIDPSESWQHIRPAARILMQSGVMTQLYNYPLCAVDRGYWPICRQSISPYKVRFAPECDACIMKESCSGFFSSTLHVAKPSVRPVLV